MPLLRGAMVCGLTDGNCAVARVATVTSLLLPRLLCHAPMSVRHPPVFLGRFLVDTDQVLGMFFQVFGLPPIVGGVFYILAKLPFFRFSLRSATFVIFL